MLMGGVAFALLAALAFVATRGSDPQMGYLYTDLDPSAAATITEKLKSANVEYTLSADGTSIMAPQDKLAELRMSMAGEKLGGKSAEAARFILRAIDLTSFYSSFCVAISDDGTTAHAAASGSEEARGEEGEVLSFDGTDAEWFTKGRS